MGVCTPHITDSSAADILGRIVDAGALYFVVHIDIDFGATPSPSFQGFGIPPPETLPSIQEAMLQFADPNDPMVYSTVPEGPINDPNRVRNLVYPLVVGTRQPVRVTLWT